MADYKGIIVAEGLHDPTVINKFAVYKAEITADGMPIDYDGHLGRWHMYYVTCSKKEIGELQPQITRGWYAHFWEGNEIIVIYNDKQFEMLRDNRSTWKEAIEHGREQGIPENELDFPTE